VCLRGDLCGSRGSWTGIVVFQRAVTGCVYVAQIGWVEPQNRISVYQSSTINKDLPRLHSACWLWRCCACRSTSIKRGTIGGGVVDIPYLPSIVAATTAKKTAEQVKHVEWVAK
jgi:hypothetical protein